jgi:hypothetical protein
MNHDSFQHGFEQHDPIAFNFELYAWHFKYKRYESAILPSVEQCL